MFSVITMSAAKHGNSDHIWKSLLEHFLTLSFLIFELWHAPIDQFRKINFHNSDCIKNDCDLLRPLNATSNRNEIGSYVRAPICNFGIFQNIYRTSIYSWVLLRVLDTLHYCFRWIQSYNYNRAYWNWVCIFLNCSLLQDMYSVI